MVELTEQQRRVLRLVADCLSNEAIGDELGISTRTVEVHIKSIAARLQCPLDRKEINRRAWLVRWWYQSATRGVPTEGEESIGARIRREGVDARHVLLARLAAEGDHGDVAAVGVDRDVRDVDGSATDPSPSVDPVETGSNLQPMMNPYDAYLRSMAARTVAADAALDDGDVGTYEIGGHPDDDAIDGWHPTLDPP